MSNESNFLIEVSGRPINDTAVERFSRIIHRILVREDSKVRLATVNFARLFYKLSWSGLPGDMYYITLAHKRIIKDVGEYFGRIEYTVKIDIIDKGEGI